MTIFSDYVDSIRRQGRPLIAAHRGLPGGVIPPNTVRAARAGLASGADIIELDVARSLDGVYYTFHDSYEPRLVSTDRRLTEMTSAEIDALRYWEHENVFDCGIVERFADTLAQLPQVMVNVDRSYRYWGDGFLTELGAMADPDYLLVKCLCRDEQLNAFRQANVNFPFMGVAHSIDQVETFLELDWRLEAIEIVTGRKDDPMLSEGIIEKIKSRGIAVWLNAINLENPTALCAGYDDMTSIMDDPACGWGRLYELGADIIQTDWPALARSHFATLRG